MQSQVTPTGIPTAYTGGVGQVVQQPTPAGSLSISTLGKQAIPVAVPASAWSPRDIDNELLYLSFARGASMWVENSSNAAPQTHPVLSGTDVIGTVYDQKNAISCYGAATYIDLITLLPTENQMGPVASFSGGNGQWLVADNTSQLLENFWCSGQLTGTIMLKYRLSASPASTYTLLDCAGANSSNIGLTLQINTSGNVVFSVYAAGAGGGVLGTVTSSNTVTSTAGANILICSMSCGYISVQLNSTVTTAALGGTVALVNGANGHPAYNGTVTSTRGASAGTAATYNLTIGSVANNGGSRYDGSISDIVITSTDLTLTNLAAYSAANSGAIAGYAQSGGTDVTRWIAYSPSYTFERLPSSPINAAEANYNLTNLNNIGGYASAARAPNQVSNLFMWLDFTDATQIYTTCTGTAPSITPGGTHVVNNGDNVAFVWSKGVPNSLGRCAYNTATDTSGNGSGTPFFSSASNTYPKWGTSAMPAARSSRGCVNWAGTGSSSYTNPGTGGIVPQPTENTLAFCGGSNPAGGVPQGDWTMFVVVYSEITDPGTEVITNGGSDGDNSIQLGGTANGTEAPISNCALAKFASAGDIYITGTPNKATAQFSGGGWNVIEIVKSGQTASIWLNGYWTQAGVSAYDTINTESNSYVYPQPSPTGGGWPYYGTLESNLGGFTPSYIGRPAAGHWNWNQTGPIAHYVVYEGAKDAETRRQLRTWLAENIADPVLAANCNLAY